MTAARVLPAGRPERSATETTKHARVAALRRAMLRHEILNIGLNDSDRVQHARVRQLTGPAQ